MVRRSLRTKTRCSGTQTSSPRRKLLHLSWNFDEIRRLCLSSQREKKWKMANRRGMCWWIAVSMLEAPFRLNLNMASVNPQCFHTIKGNKAHKWSMAWVGSTTLCGSWNAQTLLSRRGRRQRKYCPPGIIATNQDHAAWSSPPCPATGNQGEEQDPWACMRTVHGARKTQLRVVSVSLGKLWGPHFCPRQFQLPGVPGCVSAPGDPSPGRPGCLPIPAAAAPEPSTSQRPAMDWPCRGPSGRVAPNLQTRRGEPRAGGTATHKGGLGHHWLCNQHWRRESLPGCLPSAPAPWAAFRLC